MQEIIVKRKDYQLVEYEDDGSATLMEDNGDLIEGLRVP